MTIDLILKPSCSSCGSTQDLYGSTCKHLTLCVSCGKNMAEKRAKCFECGTTITRLIREYNVRASSNNDKNYFIGRFISGLPNFSKKKSENKWSLQKEGLLGRQVTDTLREKYKNKPWLLEDETGTQYHGHLEGAQSATYYLLMLQGREFVAIPAGSWYNFNKVAQYKQLTLEEAEEKMKNRRRTADGYERWMMKAANNGAAAFGEVEKFDDKEAASGSGKGRKKTGGDEEEAHASDRGEEDEDEEAARKDRLQLNKKGGDDDEGPRGGDLDMDDDDIEKGDDWEHEEIFTDDEEAMDPEEREDLAPEIPAPPEIRQDDDDENEGEEEEGNGGLSKSGKELKKLLGKANGLNESDAEDDDDDDDMEDDISPVLAPKQKEALKEEPVENNSTPSKPVASGSARGTPSTSKSAKGKRKINAEESKITNSAPLKKVKSENDVKPTKEEISATKNAKVVSPQPSSKSSSTPSTGPVTKEEIRAVLLQNEKVTTQDLVAKFKSRLKSKEDKNGFAEILRAISKIKKDVSGSNFVVLRDG